VDRDGIKVNRNLTIPNDELDFTFMPSGGPGGQHANRSSTKVVLAWNVAGSRVLGPRQRQRIQAGLRSRIDSSGVLRLSSDRHRSQLRNRVDVSTRMGELIARALRPVKHRTATNPTRASKERRMKGKRHRGEIKKARRRPGPED
jgi:ribosome-associated protein